ncbi:MAG: hypothetical protein KDD04_02835 [Sinomicrobium sp.]|nr:hypothetical protein [Sinomicrobium sp.]
MSGGYQSDTNLGDLTFAGDFPIENSLGGYGETTGAGDDYALTLDPPITQYRTGMSLQVRFNHANMGAATLDVDGQGAVPILKSMGMLLEADDLNTTHIYNLIYTGASFQAGVPVRLTGGESALGNPFANGHVLQSTTAGVRSWRAANSRLFTSYGTISAGGDLNENNLGSAYNMPAGTLSGDQALEINISGNFQNATGDKTLRVYLGAEVILTYASNLTGGWSIRIVGGRFNTDTFKGEAAIIHAGVDTDVQVVQTAGLQMDTTDQLIRITHQNANVGGLLNRFSFIIRHLV